ncbi:sigma-70 family RNA polymerase sigma factor [Sinorhizobium meliloti]|nr:sigma-70 family RNA polymerase sigma factor [Sinorhizobium meliloti]MDX0265374.1 sigma-70 family RNA polymerase sigma factor [Sinorhizobium meliloti]MDX0352790.1 sigma-70 family RNA polymerase sigma factor [Sinorhizobium meliloti]
MSGIMRSRVERRLEPHYARLFADAVALSRDRDGAQDIFQECIARALDARSVPETEPAFRAWLFAILRNIWIDQSRLRRRRSDLEQEFVTDLVPAPVAPETVLVDAFSVRQAFTRLSTEHREILALVDISGFSYEEVAMMIAVPKGTVMSRVSRARRALASYLGDANVVELARHREGRK